MQVYELRKNIGEDKERIAFFNKKYYNREKGKEKIEKKMDAYADTVILIWKQTICSGNKGRGTNEISSFLPSYYGGSSADRT